MNPSLEETIYVDFVTSSPTTGAATDADSLPTAEVFEDSTDTPIITPTVVKRTGKTGNYRVPIACTAASGFEAAKSYNAVVSATVGGVAAKAVIRTFQMRLRDIDDVSTYAGGDTAGTTTLLTRLPSALTVTGGAVTVGTVNDKTGYALTAAYDPAKTAMQAGSSVTVGTNNDKTGYSLVAAYDPAKTAAQVGSAMTLTAAYDAAKTAASQTSVNTVDDFIDTEVSAIKAVTDKLDTALEIDGAVYRYTTNALEMAPTGSGGGATAAAIADAVWDEAMAEHLTAGSTGAKLNASGAASDPWGIPVPGAYAAGTAGNILGNRVDVAVSTRSSQASNDQIYAAIDTEVGAIKAKTDNLPADPASAGTINSAFSGVNTKLDAIDDFVDTEVSAIKGKTDQLTFTGGRVDATAPTSIVAGDLVAIADAILKRDWTAVSGEAAYSLLNAARMLRNAWNTPAGVLTVKKEDGSTTAWTRTLAVDPTAQPIVGAT